MYPVTYEADYQRDRNRLTTFFRIIVVIPWLIVAMVYWIAAYVVVAIAWFALLILGRYPKGMYNFVGGVLRFSMKVSGFLSLQTDAWPGFGLSDDPAYPIRVRIAEPAAKQSRLKVFFRLILLIPAFVISILMQYAIQYIVVISWLTIVFRGYQPAAVHNALAYILGYSTRFTAYALYMRDEYPPVGDEVEVDVAPPAAQPALATYEEEVVAAPEIPPADPNSPPPSTSSGL